MESQRIESEKRRFYDLERRAQEYLNELYKDIGAIIVSRNGNTKRDLVVSVNGKELKIEEKIRNASVSGIQDIAIEILQDMSTTGAYGWFYTEEFDYLVYAWCKDTGEPIKVLSIDWEKFKAWFLNWLCEKKHVAALVSCKGWGKTINILVPIKSIPRNLYKELV